MASDGQKVARMASQSAGNGTIAVRQTPLLTIIRHPETVGNVAHILQGSTDSPLSVYGQAQLTALSAAVRAAHGTASTADGARLCQSSSPLLKPGRKPTHILASPLGRALQLGKAIERAVLGDCEGGEATSKVPSILEVRPNLSEKGFGMLEGTRKGEHVAGFPRDHGPRESSEIWSRRVQKEARYIFDLMQSSEKSIPPPHIVVVTHGLWIGTFCSIFVPDRLSFMSNTAILSLAARTPTRLFSEPEQKIVSSTAKSVPKPQPISLTMLAAADTSHLAGVKRQRGGIGSSASDKRQRTLQNMWSPKKNKT